MPSHATTTPEQVVQAWRLFYDKGKTPNSVAETVKITPSALERILVGLPCPEGSRCRNEHCRGKMTHSTPFGECMLCFCKRRIEIDAQVRKKEFRMEESGGEVSGPVRDEESTAERR